MDTKLREQGPQFKSFDYEQVKYWVAFRRIAGVGHVRMGQLYAHFGDIGLAWRATAEELTAAGLASRMIDRILEQRPGINPDLELQTILEAGFDVIVRHDSRYPVRLKEVGNPPSVLFVRGSLTPEDGLAVAVVGTRKMTSYGRHATNKIVRDLASAGVTIVSGLARGVDTHAHKAALEGGTRTIAVMGSGPDIIYPPENRGLAERIVESGALVTDFPVGTQPEAGNFPARNEIIAGITLGTLVIEADRRSGALITAKSALHMDREVFAVPGDISSPGSAGCNWLIQQQGAKLVTSAQDIMDELNIERTRRQTDIRRALPLSEEAIRILEALSDAPVHIDDLCRTLDVPVAELSSQLMMLRLDGLVDDIGGMVYEKI